MDIADLKDALFREELEPIDSLRSGKYKSGGRVGGLLESTVPSVAMLEAMI